MPVLVTGAENAAGRAAVRALLRGGGQVRAFVDEAAAPPGTVDELRGLGCKVARGELDDEGRLERALEQVHTVVHLAGGLLDPPAELLDGLAGVVSAAIGAGCRRLVWVSHLGADAPGGDPWLDACAEGEELLGEAPLESVVLRGALTYGPGDALTEILAAGVPPTLRMRRHAPLFVEDLALAIVAADRHRRDTSAPQVRVELAGPEVTTLEEFAQRLAAGALGRPGGDALPPHTIAALDRDQEPGPATLGTEGTSLEEGLRRTRAG